MDKEKLVKLLNMTASDSDREALTAIRMANSHLKQASLTWGDIIGFKKEATRPNPFAGFHGSSSRTMSDNLKVDRDGYWSGSDIDEMLDALDKNTDCNSGFRSFVDGVTAKYEKEGRLTTPQYQSVKRFYDRIKKGRTRSFK